MCNIPSRGHSWKSPVQADPGFVCGKCISNCELMRSAELNSVSATITLDTDIATIKPGSSSRKAFESAFTTDIAKAVGDIDKKRVRILGIQAGSVIVNFRIAADKSGKAIAESAITKAFSSTGVSIAGSKTTTKITKVSGNYPPPPPPPPSTCFYRPGRPLHHSCKCHPTCATCGYSSSPIGDKDCIKCKHGQVKAVHLYSDGTGMCPLGPPPPAKQQQQTTTEAEEDDSSGQLNSSWGHSVAVFVIMAAIVLIPAGVGYWKITKSSSANTDEAPTKAEKDQAYANPMSDDMEVEGPAE